MKLRVFAIRDSKLGVFNAPFAMPHVGQAIRGWQEACLDGKSQPSKYPDDFALYEIGTFDEDTGVLVPHSQHTMLASAREMVQASKKVSNNGADRAQLDLI